MSPDQYIQLQPSGWQAVLKNIHAIILEKDKTVEPVVEPMMRNEMIVYKEKGMMKYGLAGVKKHMSLHLLPMYMCAEIHARYKGLLSKASFQKGCINFSSADEMPAAIVQQLIHDCSKVDLQKVRDNYAKSKKAAKQ